MLFVAGVASITVGVLCILTAIGIEFDAAIAVCLLMAIGNSVDYLLHLLYHFFHAQVI